MDFSLPEDTVSCCRTCLNSASTNMFEIFDDREDHFSVAKMIAACTAVKIDANDMRYPQRICRSCYHSLMSFYDFKKVAEGIDQKLNEYFHNQTSIDLQIKDDNSAFFDSFVDEKFDVENGVNYYSDDDIPLAQYNTDEEISTQKIKKAKQKDKPKWKCKTEYQTYICAICSQTFKYNLSYIKHMEKHSSLETKKKKEVTNQIPCDMCTKTFRNANALAAHKRRHVSKNRILACRVCGKIFKKISHLKRHELCHEDRPFKCPQCKKSFMSEAGLVEHVDYKHKGIRPYPCPICAKGFAHQAVLTNHIRLHMRERPYLCPTCGKRFESSNNLKQHVSRHIGVRMFQCDLCPKKFITKGELKKHRDTHSGARPYTCEQCGSAYTKYSSLKKHKLRHLGIKPYMCDSCPKRFTLKEQLKVHTRVHTGEKPYKCSHCERAFSQSGDLLKHRRAHFGNQLYNTHKYNAPGQQTDRWNNVLAPIPSLHQTGEDSCTVKHRPPAASSSASAQFAQTDATSVEQASD